MDSEDRNQDKKHALIPSPETGKARTPISFDVIKSVYICEGISAKEIAERFSLPVASVERVIKENNLEDLRSAYIREGIRELQSLQLNQAQKLMDLESSFKKMRILQLEKRLEDFMVYYKRHGHFNKVHPVTGEVLLDGNGIPMQISIPNVAKELQHLKETFNLSEGLKNLLGTIDAIINKPKDVESLGIDDAIDMKSYDNIFKKREEE